MRNFLAKVPLAVHVYRLVKVVMADPLNRGFRARFVYRYLLWFGYQRPTGQRTLATLANGMRSWVYADSDAGVSYLFTRNVDYYDDIFVRKILHAGDFIVDAGCNVGNRMLGLADIIGGALLLDANPLCLERLTENLELNHLDPNRFHQVPQAVGAEVGILSFSDLGATDCSNHVLDDVEAPAAHDSIRRVPVTTIDTEVLALGNPACAYIKLDLEGYDLEGLRGARQTLTENQVRLVKFERWQSVALEPFENFFQEIDWVLVGLDHRGTPTIDRRVILRVANLFGMPRSRWEELAA